MSALQLTLRLPRKWLVEAAAAAILVATVAGAALVVVQSGRAIQRPNKRLGRQHISRAATAEPDLAIGCRVATFPRLARKSTSSRNARSASVWKQYSIE